MTRLGALRLEGAALFAGGAIAVALLAAPSIASAGSTCVVINARTRTHYEALQAAVTDATAGDRLRVSGVCTGTTVIDRKLVLQGAPGASERPVLDGGDAGRVLEIASGVTVRVEGLAISNGRVRGAVGGGIRNDGTLTLTDVVVSSNRADDGGGIYSTGELLLKGATVVKRNRAKGDDGGGIYLGGGKLTMTDASTVHHNTALRGGGGIYAVGADVTIDGTTSVHDNEAATGGGGIYVDFDATLAASGSSAVHDNVAGENGGGVFDNSSMTMSESSSIGNNTAGLRGGGVFVGCSAALTGADAGGNVRGNQPSNVARETGCP